jgi:DNA-binding transcriptional LysR family regulator
VQALNRVGRTCEFVYTSRSIVGLEAAVVAGMGVMVLPRSRVGDTCLSIWENPPLPELPNLYCGVFLREGSNWAPLEELADEIGEAVRPRPVETVGEPLPLRARMLGTG